MTSVDKKELWQYVNRKLKRLIHHSHVFAIITILFEEMIKDLESGKTIKIAKFGTIMLKKMPPRQHHDVTSGQTMQSPGNRTMRLVLAKLIQKKLRQSLDLDKKI